MFTVFSYSGATCDVPAYNASIAYMDAGTQVSFEGKIYKVADGQWVPVGCTPTGTWSYLWVYLSDCGDTGTGNTGDIDDNSGTNDTGAGHTLVSCIKKHIVVGYWHNFNNGTSNGLKLSDVSTGYDFLNVSFGETAATDRAVITFVLDNSIYTTDAAFIADIKTVQSRGKKVNLSLGGANGIISVKSEGDKTKFVNSVISIIDKYGFDGLDIDFEGTSAGGTSPSFDRPNTDAQLMISAIRQVCDHYGNKFILSMAPETAYVQFGINASVAPAYLTLIYGLRDKLTVLHVQDYNTGSSNDLYGNIANPGSADYHVAMTEMLLQGFPCCGKTFPALREDQVAFGVPATSGAGGGFIAMDELKKAMKYLITGVKSAGMNYTLKKPAGYPDLRGIMTWSVNWDKTSNYALANTFSTYFTEIGNPTVGCDDVVADTQTPSIPTSISGTPTQTTINISWTASTDNVGVNGYNIYVGGTYKGSTAQTTYSLTGLTAKTSYLIQIEAYDGSNNKSAKSTGITVTTLENTTGGGTTGGGTTGGGTTECAVPAWDATKHYGTQYEEVSYNGKVYKCLVWWTTAGAAPDVTTTQWSYVSDCGGGTTGGGTTGGGTTGGEATGIDYVNGKRIVVYFPNWGTYNTAHQSLSVDMIPWNKITHVNHAFFTVGSDFKLITTDEYSDYQKAFSHSEAWGAGDRLAGHLGEYKYFKSQYPGVKIIISVGGWTRGENFHAMALSSANRAIFINSVVAFLKKYTFIDGIDLDWEYPGINRAADSNDGADKGCPGGIEDKTNFTLLLKEIREAYNANGLSSKELSIAVSVNPNTVSAGANPAEYQQYVDLINLMSYDMHGAFERITNHHAAIYANPNDPSPTQVERVSFNAKAAGELYASLGVPKSKITIGSPWYSRGWGGVTAGPKGDGLFQAATGYERGTWDDAQTTAPGGQYPWFYVKTLETTAGWVKHFDNAAQVPYLFNVSTGVFLTYEDEQSLASRCDFINNNNYGGLIVWEISGDNLTNGAPMTTIAYNKLLKKASTSETKLIKDVNYSISPNPAIEALNIQIEENAKVKIFDISGMLVYNGTLLAGSNKIDVLNYRKGLYLIKIEGNNINLTVKQLIK